MLYMIWTSIRGGRKVIFGGGTACEKEENFLFIGKLVEADKLQVVLVKTFPFEEMVEAHRYAETGSTRGSITVRIAQDV